jgi:trigger factor
MVAKQQTGTEKISFSLKNNKSYTCEVTPKDGNETNLNFEILVDEKELTDITNDKVNEISSTVSIKGFRPGKVPTSIVRSKYAANIKHEVFDDVIESILSNLFDHKKIEIYTRPKVDIVSYDDKKLIVSLGVETCSEIELPDYESIEIINPEYEVTKQDVYQELENLQEAFKRFDAAEDGYAAVKGDAVIIDFVGYIDDKEFEGGAGKNHRLVLGSNSFIPGFEDQLLGASKGQKVEVNVEFPQEYHAKEYAGRKSKFDVTVHNIEKATKEELNDEFAIKFGTKSLVELEELVKLELSNRLKDLVNEKQREELFEKLDNIVDFSVPASMLENEAKQIEKMSGGISEEEKSKITKRRVKLGILFTKIAKHEGLKVTQQDIQNQLMKIMKGFPGQEKIVYDYYSKNKQAVQSLHAPAIEDKVVDFILTKVTLKAKKFMKLDLSE